MGVGASLEGAYTPKEGDVIRDAEIEDILKAFITPLFQIAGLEAKALQLVLVVDRTMNAAAAPGHTLILNTGLILRCDSPEKLVAVIAHEVGHMASHHINDRIGAMKKSSLLSVGSMILGAAGALAGSPDAAMGLMMGGMQASHGILMRYSQGQEAAADIASIRFLNGLQWPTHGAIELQEMLKQQELLTDTMQEPYVISHPTGEARISLLKEQIRTHPAKGTSLPADLQERYKRLLAKMQAYSMTAFQVRALYEKDDSIPAHYARAIAAYREGAISQALASVERVLQASPQDAYAYELKGQILFDEGRIEEALQAYEQALKEHPKSPLILAQAAQCLVEKAEPSALEKARLYMQYALEEEKENTSFWRTLGIIEGRLSNRAASYLALAEAAFHAEEWDLATQQAERALKEAAPNAPSSMRAQDILHLAKEKGKEEHPFSLDRP